MKLSCIEWNDRIKLFYKVLETFDEKSKLIPSRQGENNTKRKLQIYFASPRTILIISHCMS